MYILPHSVVFFINNPTTNCTILLQNDNILPQTGDIDTMNGSVSTTEKICHYILVISTHYPTM